jgi:MinD superfamily P-loop ATPase
VDHEACSECGTCEERCWFGAITLKAEDGVVVNDEKCLGCGQCAVSCPEAAIQMTEVRDPAFIPG